METGSSKRKPTFTLRDLLVLAFFHKRVILILAMLPVAIGLGAALITKTQYTADGLLLVIVNRQYNTSAQDVTGNGPTILTVEGLKAVESEIQIIRSSDVIKKVITQIGIDRLFPSLSSPNMLGFIDAPGEEQRLEKAADLFRDRLGAEVQADSNILQVSFRHPNATLAAEVVNTLIDVYLDRRRELYADDRSPFLQAEVQRFSEQLQAAEDQIERVKADYGVLDIDQDVLLAINQVDSILQRTRQLSERREAAVFEAQKAADDLAAAPEMVTDFKELSNKTDNIDDHNILVGMILERDHMAQEYSADYPGVKALDSRIATLRKAMRTNDSVVFFNNREARNPLLDFLNRQLLTLRAEGGALANQLGEMQRQREDGLARIDQLREAQAKLYALTRQRDVLDQIYREYVMRAEAARIEAQANRERSSNVNIVQWASPPVDGSNLAMSFLLAGIIGGLLVGAAAGGVATFLRQVFILPSEAEEALGMACLAEFGDNDMKFEGPEAPSELLYLASLLCDVTKDGRRLELLQFVPLGPKDGASLMVRALAKELAQGRGLRTLLVDPNEDWRDQLRALGAVDRTETAAGGKLAVAATAIPQLWIAAQPEESGLLSLRTPLTEAQELLVQLRGQYDVVLFVATHPSFGTQSRRLATLVDANILVVRAEFTRGPTARQVRDIILRTGGDLLGFVFTNRRYYIPKAVYRWL